MGKKKSAKKTTTSSKPKAAASPAPEKPKAEKPKAEEPKAEEPKAEEPKAEEPKAEPVVTVTAPSKAPDLPTPDQCHAIYETAGGTVYKLKREHFRTDPDTGRSIKKIIVPKS